MRDAKNERLKIFLCHSSYQKPLLREVKRELSSWIDAWIDERELRAGEFLSSEIRKVIAREVRYVVIFFSKEATESAWVQQELRWALEREDRLGREIIIPVLIERADEIWKRRAPNGLEGRFYLHLRQQDEESVRNLAKTLVEHICRLLVRDLNYAVMTPISKEEGELLNPPLTARFWRRRSEFSSQDWRDLFASATNRIWLLGHSMEPSVNPQASGHILAERLAAGVDVRLVVLDPLSRSNHQLAEIAREIGEPDLRDKIFRTLTYAEWIE